MRQEYYTKFFCSNFICSLADKFQDSFCDTEMINIKLEMVVNC